jgi:cytochrome c oxidase subunit 1
MTAAVLNAHNAQDHPIGWRRYVYSTNHKDIGTMYLVFAIAAGVIGGAFSILIRMEFQEPGLQIFSNPHYFNVVASAHVWAARLNSARHCCGPLVSYSCLRSAV